MVLNIITITLYSVEIFYNFVFFNFVLYKKKYVYYVLKKILYFKQILRVKCFLFSFSVLELIYWRDLKKTGVVFGSMLFILLSLAIFSVLSVLAYLSLAVLTVTLSFRIYKNVLAAVQKSGDAHPFKYELLTKNKLAVYLLDKCSGIWLSFAFIF